MTPKKRAAEIYWQLMAICNAEDISRADADDDLDNLARAFEEAENDALERAASLGDSENMNYGPRTMMAEQIRALKHVADTPTP